MIIGSILLLVLFIIWSFLVKKDKLVKIDKYIYQKFVIKEPQISILKVITCLASTKFFILLAILLLMVWQNKYIYTLVVLLILTALIITVLKHSFRRERPKVRQLVKEKGFSYPSGHSFSALVFYGWLGLLTVISPWNILIKGGIVLLLSGLILVIGYSRIYLGVHYFSDVVGAFLSALTYLGIFSYFIFNVLNIL